MLTIFPGWQPLPSQEPDPNVANGCLAQAGVDMPLKVDIRLGANTFEVEGDFAFDAAFTTFFRTWINAQEIRAVDLEVLAEQLEQQNDQLEQVVQESTISLAKEPAKRKVRISDGALMPGRDWTDGS